jgi:hypothetical protein
MNIRLQWQLDNAKQGLKFEVLQRDIKLYVFVDVLFANNKDLSSQIGYVIVLGNKTKINDKTVSLYGNILH